MPLTTAQAILGSSAIGALSGFLGGGGDNPPPQRFGKQIRLQEESTQRVMENQLQWRMKDAKAAGIHPLFALGGSIPSGGSPVIAGQNVQRTPGPTQRALSAVSQGLATYAQVMSSAKLNNSMANYYDSQAAMATQPGLEADKNTAAAVPSPAPNRFYKEPGTKIVPSEQVAHAPGQPETSAGQHPYYQKYVIRKAKDGTPYYIYGPRSDEPAEAFENVGGIVMSIGKNFGMGVDQLTGHLSRAYNISRRRAKAWIKALRSDANPSTGYWSGR